MMVLERVLVIEDDQDVAELVADVLQIEGFEARIATGHGVVEEAISFRPDVILLDLMMPEVDGFEVARRLRADERAGEVPIIIMSAMHDPAGHSAHVGARDTLAKPFDIAELIRTIRRVLD
jgi:two-component system response regulator RpaA